MATQGAAMTVREAAGRTGEQGGAEDDPQTAANHRTAADPRTVAGSEDRNAVSHTTSISHAVKTATRPVMTARPTSIDAVSTFRMDGVRTASIAATTRITLPGIDRGCTRRYSEDGMGQEAEEGFPHRHETANQRRRVSITAQPSHSKEPLTTAVPKRDRTEDRSILMRDRSIPERDRTGDRSILMRDRSVPERDQTEYRSVGPVETEQSPARPTGSSPKTRTSPLRSVLFIDSLKRYIT